jgi:5'-deoxynucleotidase YfbR-like HD superfamily hydrolase
MSVLNEPFWEDDYIKMARQAYQCDVAGDIEERNRLRGLMKELDKVNSDRIGTWIPLTSGARYWPEDPRPGDFNVYDISYGLSMICRFNGHTEHFYSVAQHSCYVHDITEPEYRLFALLHDASEAMLGDVITPVKRLIRDKYHPLEEKLMHAIAEQFGFVINEATEAIIKKSDRILLSTEVRDVSCCGFINGDVGEKPMDVLINDFWTPERARRQFMSRFNELCNA